MVINTTAYELPANITFPTDPMSRAQRRVDVTFICPAVTIDLVSRPHSASFHTSSADDDHYFSHPQALYSRLHPKEGDQVDAGGFKVQGRAGADVPPPVRAILLSL
jgi:hypothetical protein